MWLWLLPVLGLLILLAVMPTWPYSRGWGWYPPGLAGVLTILLVLVAWYVAPTV